MAGFACSCVCSLNSRQHVNLMRADTPHEDSGVRTPLCHLTLETASFHAADEVKLL